MIITEAEERLLADPRRPVVLLPNQPRPALSAGARTWPRSPPIWG